ncbi:MAG: signal peptidase I [Deltaproteobacteria bacterium]|nr:MAG: signal peptidase I [Deltaproteobacteria bacterium]
MQETIEFDKKLKKKGSIREYIEALLTALVVAFFIRSFGVEAFKIPSGSMIPTLMIGDHIFVNKAIYGLRIPFTKKKLIHFRDPKRGEAIVFMYPLDESKDFIKRVIGLPGDKIKIDGDEIYINGEKLVREELKTVPNQPGSTNHIAVTMPESSHIIQRPISNVPAFPSWQDYAFLRNKWGDHSFSSI